MSTATLSLADVLSVVADGAGSTAEVARRTGTSIDVAETALAALSAAGRVRRSLVFAAPCGPEDCGGCASAAGCAAAGLGSPVGSGLTTWRVVPR